MSESQGPMDDLDGADDGCYDPYRPENRLYEFKDEDEDKLARLVSKQDKLNLAQINKTVNELAGRLASQDPSKPNDTLPLTNSIMELMFRGFSKFSPRMDQFGNECRFYPLLGKMVPSDVFTDTLLELLGTGKDGRWRFDPGKAQFVTAFSNTLRFRLVTYYNEHAGTSGELRRHGMTEVSKQRDTANPDVRKTGGTVKRKVENAALKGIRVVSLDDVDKHGKRVAEQIADERAAYNELIEGETRFAAVIHNLEQVHKHLKKKEWGYVSALFTFDTVAAIKGDREYAKTACKRDTGLFPFMMPAVLERLMVGNFSSMRDIAENPLRPDVNLDQRQSLVAEALGVTRQTISEHSVKYDVLRKAIVRRQTKLSDDEAAQLANPAKDPEADSSSRP
jgi:hypothetical protein